MLKAAPNIQIRMNHVLSGVKAIQVPNGYACASSARGADAAVRPWPAARSRLTAVIVSAGQVPGLVMRSGGAAANRLRDADLGGPCRVSFDW